MYSATNSDIAPTPPTPTPTPIPAFAPVVRPPELEIDVADGVADEMAEGIDVADVVSGPREVDVEVGVGVASFMFQPTTPIAPTVDVRDNVVVAVFHAVESP